MKRRAKTRRIMAVLLSAIMVLSLCMTTFAEESSLAGFNSAVTYGQTEHITPESGDTVGETAVLTAEIAPEQTVGNQAEPEVTETPNVLGDRTETVAGGDQTETTESLAESTEAGVQTEPAAPEEPAETKETEVNINSAGVVNKEKSVAVQAFLDAVAAISIPQEMSSESGQALHEQIGAASAAYDALSEEELSRDDVQAAVLIMVQAMNVLTGGVQTLDSLYNPVTIQARVICQNPWTEIFLGGNDKAYAGSGTESYQAYYQIPDLNHFLEGTAYEGYNFGRVTKVVSSYHLPASGEAQVGQNVEFGTNNKTQTITYWVTQWTPGNGGGGTGYLWNFTLKYDANDGTGAPATQTYGTDSKYEKSHTFTIPNTVPTRQGYTFKGWSDAGPNAASPTHQPGVSYSMIVPGTGYNGGSVTKTLYAVWEKEQTNVTCDKEKIIKVFNGINSNQVPDNFDIDYKISSAKGGEGTLYAQGTITNFFATTVSGQPAYEMSIPSFTVPSEQAWYVTIKENNAKIPGYSYTLDTSSKQVTYARLGSTLYFYNTYTKESTPVDPTVTDIKKEVAETVLDGLTVPDNITYPVNGAVTVPAGTSSVTLLYRITVSGAAGAEYTVADDGATCISNNVTGTIPENGSVVLYFTKTFTDLKTGENTCSNTASVEDTDLSDSATVTVTVEEPETPPQTPDWSNLTVEKRANKTTVRPGEDVTYTIKVINHTGRDLSNIKVSEQLDDDLTLVSAAPAEQYDSANGIWVIPALANGMTAVLTIEAVVNSNMTDKAVIRNAAVVTDASVGDDAKLPDGTAPDDNADITVDYPAPAEPSASGLAITKTADKETVKAGEGVAYTIEVKNTTGQEIAGITLKDFLPGGLTGNVEITSDSGLTDFTLTDNIIIWNSISLAGNTSKTVKVIVQISPDVGAGTVVTNRVQASAEGYRTVEDSANVTVDSDGNGETPSKGETPTTGETPTKGETPAKEDTPTKDDTTIKESTTTKDNTASNQSQTNSAQTSSPKTGDNSNIILWIMLLALSAAVIAGTFVANKKRQGVK